VKLRASRALLALCLTLFAAAPALAQDEKVPVQVEVVLASSKGSEVQPPELAKMKATFTKQSFSFTSFKRLSMQTLEVTAAKPSEVKLPNGVNASLQLLKFEKGTATVRVDVPQLTATDVELGRQGSIYQLAGDHVGGKLILVLSQPKS
jgi:hypothetical protein